MNEKINQELLKLQKELSTLESAVKQIDKAGKISTEVINSVKEVSKKYDTSIVSLERDIKNVFTDLNNSTSKKINDLVDTQKRQQSEFKKQLDDVQLQIKKSDNNSAIEIKSLTAETRKEVKTLTDSHDEQIEKVNALLTRYLELAKSTSELADKLDNINFPARLNQISVNVGDMNTEIRDIQKNIKEIKEDTTVDDLTKRVRKNNRKINFNSFLTIITFIIVLFIAYQTIVLKYFPNLDFLKILFNK